VAQAPQSGLGALILRFLDHTQLDTHTHPVGLLRTSDQLVAEAATYATHNKHKTQHIDDLNGIRTRNISIQETTDLRHRPHSHRNRPTVCLISQS